MGSFNPVPPQELLDAFQPAQSGVDLPALIADLAEAGLIKGYARRISGGGNTQAPPPPDAKMAAELWSRIIREGRLSDIWSTGTVRLDETAGGPAISIIGIRFEPDAVRRALIHHGVALRTKDGSANQALASASAKASPPARPKPVPAVKPPVISREAVHTPSKPAAPATTIAYTMKEAQAVLKVGRTQMYQYRDQGLLTFNKLGRLVRIPAAEVDKLAAGGN